MDSEWEISLTCSCRIQEFKILTRLLQLTINEQSEQSVSPSRRLVWRLYLIPYHILLDKHGKQVKIVPRPPVPVRIRSDNRAHSLA